MPAIHFNYCCRGAATPFRTSRSHRLPRAGLVKVSQRWALGGGIFFFSDFFSFLLLFSLFAADSELRKVVCNPNNNNRVCCVCDGTGNICRMITVCRPTLAASATCPRACRVPSFLKLAAEPHYKSHLFFFFPGKFSEFCSNQQEKRET